MGWTNVCFIEVKTRTAHDLTPAETAVDEHKRNVLRRLARRYVRQLPQQTAPPVRFDVVSVYLSPGAKGNFSTLRDRSAGARSGTTSDPEIRTSIKAARKYRLSSSFLKLLPEALHSKQNSPATTLQVISRFRRTIGVDVRSESAQQTPMHIPPLRRVAHRSLPPDPARNSFAERNLWRTSIDKRNLARETPLVNSLNRSNFAQRIR